MKFRTALLAIVVSAIVAGSLHAQTLRVTIKKAPIRTGPGSQETLLTTAMQGDLLEYVDVEGLYYIVRVPGTQQVGYVHSALVEQTAGRAPAMTQQPPARTAPPPPRSAPVAQPCAPPPPPPRRTPPPPPPPPRREQPQAEQLPNTPPSIDPSEFDDSPWEQRKIGVGGRFGHSTLGDMAFNFRSFGNSLGFSLDSAGNEFYWQLQPSLMFKIGSPIETEALYFQPYAGVGADLMWGRIDSPILEDGYRLVGLGGADIGFMAVPNLTVSLDLGYNSSFINGDCRSDCFTSNFSDRLGLNFGVNWYFK